MKTRNFKKISKAILAACICFALVADKQIVGVAAMETAPETEAALPEVAPGTEDAIDEALPDIETEDAEEAELPGEDTGAVEETNANKEQDEADDSEETDEEEYLGEGVPSGEAQLKDGTSTVRDSFGYKYTYDPENWYKNYRNKTCEGYTWKLDRINKKLILQGYNTLSPISEFLYIPATTVIDDVTYTTRIPLYGTGTYGSPFEQLPGDQLKHVYIAPGVEVVDGDNRAFGTFQGCESLQSVDMKNVDFSNVHSLDRFFQGCTSLKEVAFGTHYENVANIYYMFSGCTSLEEIDLSTLNLAGIINAESVFYNCTALEEANLSGLDLSSVTNLKYMFSDCSSLQSVNFSGLKLSFVTDMSYMFRNCSSLDRFEFPDTDTSRCTTITGMFYGCNKLKVLNLSKLKTDSLTDMSGLCDASFGNELLLQTLYLPYGITAFPEDIQSGTHNNYYTLPKKMYHNGEEVRSGTRIHTGMSGWVLTSDDIPLMDGPVSETDENGNVIQSTWKCIWFGHFFQDENQAYMDKDPIKWRILSVDSVGYALLLADHNLAQMQYHSENTEVSWANSSLRRWLNSETDGFFIRNAFSFKEKNAICNTMYDEGTANEGTDKVFLLSYADMVAPEFGFGNTDREQNGLRTVENSDYCDDGQTSWFLRDRHITVLEKGDLDVSAEPDYSKYCKVRPAIMLNLYDHTDLWTDAGTVTVDMDGHVTSEEEGREIAGSIEYNPERWKFDNDNTAGYAYAGFIGANKYRIDRCEFERFIYGIKENDDYDKDRSPSETERQRFARLFLDSSNPSDKDLSDYDYVKDHLNTWGGSCFGMSLTEGLFLSGEILSYRVGDYRMLGDLGSQATATPELESVINRHHFLQACDAASAPENCVYIGTRGLGGLGSRCESFEQLKNKAKAVRSPEDYFLISYSVPEWNGGRHSILCLGGEDCHIVDGENVYTYRLIIYDPNSSVYDDDYRYIYIGTNDQAEVGCIPQWGYYFKYGATGNRGDMFYRDKPLRELAHNLWTDDYEHKTRFIFSNMKDVEVWAPAIMKGVNFVNGVLQDANYLDNLLMVTFRGREGHVEGLDAGFQGGTYILGETDPNTAYSVKGGANDKLDACFEYGDHTVDVYADQTGASAEFSGNGDVVLKDLTGSDFAIDHVFNEDCTLKPGNATKVCVLGNATGNVTLTKSEQGVLKLTHGTGTMTDVSVVIGTTLRSEPHEEIPDAKGDITLTFENDKVILKEDTTGDGTLDHEEVFSDYIPVSGITIDPETCSVAVGKTKTLSSLILPENASDRKMLWSSDDPGTVEVEDGKIKGIKAGTTYVRVVTVGVGNTETVGTCKVTVTEGGADPGDDDIPDDAPEGIWIQGLKNEYKYTGSAIKPEFKVCRGRTRLYLNKDYSLRYTNNTKPGTATVTITMKGNYSGTKNVTFRIVPSSLGTDITADTVYLAYKKNKVQKPVPVLTVNGTKLKYTRNDLEFTYPSPAPENGTAYKDAGVYKIHVAAKNANLFTGEMDVNLVITEKPLMSAVTVRANKTSLPYDNGNAVSPKFTLSYMNKPLTEGADYTVAYADDHTAIGKHMVIFSGNGTDFIGSKTFTFTVTGKYDLTSARAEVKLDPDDLNLDGSAAFTYGGAKPGAIVTYNGTRLTAGKDYTISYIKNRSLGTATATVKGKGSYKGSIPLDFAVRSRDINTLSLNMTDVLYSSRKDAYKKVSITFVDNDYKNQMLKLDKDYTVTITGNYDDAPAAGTTVNVVISGKDNYSGTINSSYRIIDKDHDLSKAKVTVNSGKPYDYTGTEVKPAVADLTVTLNNQPLNTDCYEILGYYNNAMKGNGACLLLRGKNGYAGLKAVRFKIGAAALERLWSDIFR